MRKGFTLIELLAVLIILGLLVLIVTPVVVNLVQDSKKSTKESSARFYIDAVNLYLKTDEINNEEILEGQYSVNELSRVKVNGEKPSDGMVVIKDGEVVDYSLKIGDYIINYNSYNQKVQVSKYDVLRIKPEVQLAGLTPVVYDGDNWEVADTKTNWYDYYNKKWANAVILNDNVSKEPGTIIYPDGKNINIKAMFVWVPRYSYTIGNTYGVQLEGGDAPSQETPGAIDIKFVDKNTKENGIAAYNGDSPTGWRTHPAFTFGSQELSGIWVGKFEITGNSDAPTIIPNESSLVSQNVSTLFTAAQKFNQYLNNNGDSHMMKNSEWGAVAYLSQSKYGKYGNSEYEGTNKEIYMNNSQYYTGRSGGAPGGSTPINGTYTDQTSTDQYNTTGYYTYDGYLLKYNTNEKSNTRDILKGTGASTTGNIYGIYDMSGGAWEYVMGYYTLATNDFIKQLDVKYYDGYTTTTLANACNGEVCYGHALSETDEWYSDYYNHSLLVKSPFYRRGGTYNADIHTGVFMLGTGGDFGDKNTSSRVVYIS